MVAYIKKRLYSWMPGNIQKLYVEVACLSTDSKPTTDIVTGSFAIEVDTGFLYVFDADSATWNNIGGIGGENANRVETVTGTVADMFGDVDVATLKSALESKGASVYLTADASALGMSTIIGDLRYGLVAEGATVTSNSVLAYSAIWNDDGTLSSFYMTTDGTTFTDVSPYASLITTTLTIVWHPLP